RRSQGVADQPLSTDTMKQPEFDPHRIDRRVLISTLFRFHLAGVAILTWIIAITEPRSANALIAARPEGFMVLSVLMVAGAACMLDVVINDLMPESWHWKFARNHRHFVLTAMSACYIG